MKILDLPKLIIRNQFLFFLFIPGLIFSQYEVGRVVSSETYSGISYVNVLITGKNTGTVSDKSGTFIINLSNTDDNDTLRFSMIGYKSKKVSVGQIKEDSVKVVYLDPVDYFLREVEVIYHKTSDIKIGTSVIENVLRSGFAYNDLGSEMGIKVNVRGRLKLKDMHLDVAACTFDTVTYRLNIYQAINETEYNNILTEPIYVTFSKDKINDVITFDLIKYSIIIEGNVLIALELYKDLGEGKLLFRTNYFKGVTYHRKTSDGKWSEAAGVIGMYLHGYRIKSNTH